jgi:hypothetical protein
MMTKIVTFFRSIGIFFASALATLAVFGLLLGAAWRLAPDDGEIYKLVSSVSLSVVAVTAGGWLAAKLTGRLGWRVGALFGLVFGLCSFSYLTGDGRTLIAAPMASLFGGVGGWIADRW